MKGIAVLRVDCDDGSLPNAINVDVLGTFFGGDGLTAREEAAQFVGRLTPVTLYLSWDGRAYPEIRIQECERP